MKNVEKELQSASAARAKSLRYDGAPCTAEVEPDWHLVATALNVPKMSPAEPQSGGQEERPGENGTWGYIFKNFRKETIISGSWYNKNRSIEVLKHNTCYLLSITILLIYVYATLFI